MELSHLDSGALAVRSENVDVLAVLRDCQAALAEKAGLKNMDLKIIAPDNLPMVRADGSRLRQVIGNLADNAVKFTEAGGRVHFDAARTDAGGMKISVFDNGIGIAPNEIIRVLGDVFNRPHSDRAIKGGGVGLGLPLARALSERMGTTLHIDSDLGKGTVVSVVFPAIRVVT